MLPTGISTAEENLASIFAGAARQQSSVIDYREVRHMLLLETPWQGEGRMYVTDDAFVMLQQQPERQFIVIKKSRFWFYNPTHGGRHQGSTHAAGMQNGLALLQPLMHGNIAVIERMFRVSVSENGPTWQLDLFPLDQQKAAFTHIVIKGQHGAPADYMRTNAADGDYSEWFFTTRPFDAHAGAEMDQAIAETRGY